MIGAVAYVGTYDPGYARNAVLMAGLRERGVVAHEIHAPLPALDAAGMATPAGAARVAAGLVGAHVRLALQHRRGLDVDAVIVLAVFAKKTPATPKSILEACQRRLRDYDRITRGRVTR